MLVPLEMVARERIIQDCRRRGKRKRKRRKGAKRGEERLGGRRGEERGKKERKKGKRKGRDVRQERKSRICKNDAVSASQKRGNVTLRMVIVGWGSISTKSTVEAGRCNDSFFSFSFFHESIDGYETRNKKNGGRAWKNVWWPRYLLNRLFNGAFVIPLVGRFFFLLTHSHAVEQ